MKSYPRPLFTSPILVLLILVILSGPTFSQGFAGNYRPVNNNGSAQNTSPGNQQFAPPAKSAKSTSDYPAPAPTYSPPVALPPPVWQQPSYYPQAAVQPRAGYLPEPQLPVYNMNFSPRDMMSDFFGSDTNKYNDSLQHYPPVVPPQYAMPSAYPNVQPYVPSAPTPDSAYSYSTSDPMATRQNGQDPAPLSARSQPEPQTSKPNPRPFSNPQETGNTFVQRSPGYVDGMNDRRFRPPELKGTP